jgi:hypothetical protein
MKTGEDDHTYENRGFHMLLYPRTAQSGVADLV